MSIDASAYPAIATVTAAAIAAAVTFLMAVISKDQKTSEFRQAWIDGLRSDISEMLSAATTLMEIVTSMSDLGKGPSDLMNALSEHADVTQSYASAHARIRLRLNPTEHEKLIEVLAALRSAFDSAHFLTQRIETRAQMDAIVHECSDVLRREWKRVKRGEPVFFLTKWISLAIFLSAISVGAMQITGRLQIEVHMVKIP